MDLAWSPASQETNCSQLFSRPLHGLANSFDSETPSIYAMLVIYALQTEFKSTCWLVKRPVQVGQFIAAFFINFLIRRRQSCQNWKTTIKKWSDFNWNNSCWHYEYYNVSWHSNTSTSAFYVWICEIIFFMYYTVAQKGQVNRIV